MKFPRLLPLLCPTPPPPLPPDGLVNLFNRPHPDRREPHTGLPLKPFYPPVPPTRC